MKIKIKRIYTPPAPSDGYRVLVDRLWPRGMKKEDASFDAWEKELAPGTALRKWYGHLPDRWEEFKKRYEAELSSGPYLVSFLEKNEHREVITLLYAAKDSLHCNALVLQEALEKKLAERG